MATLELQQIKCPNCGANITSFNAFCPEVECPYCHQKSLNPIVSSKQFHVPERIIPFVTDEDDLRKSFINSLIDKDYVPTDIFECINTEEVIKMYLPMYLYEGRYNASWNCLAGTQLAKTKKGQDKDADLRYTFLKSKSAEGKSNGSFECLCLAYEGDKVPKELKKFALTFPYIDNSSEIYNPELVNLGGDDNLQALAVNMDPESVWNSRKDQVITELVENSAKGQIRKDLHIENLRFSYRCGVSKGRYILAPFWLVYYTYNGKKYHFIMDGTGNYNELSSPINTKEAVRISKHKLNIYSAKFWFILGVILIPSGLEAVIIFLIICSILMLLTKKLSSRAIVKILAESKEKRRAGAARFS